MEAQQFTFGAVEELEEAVQATGWRVGYRQLESGRLSARLGRLECERLELLSAQWDNHLQVQCEPPDGRVGMLLPTLSSGRVRLGGQDLVEGELVSFPASSEMEFVTRGGIRNETLFLPDAEFLAAARSLTPTIELLSPTSVALHRGDPERSAGIRSRMQALHGNGGLDPETASALLAAVILWIADAEHRDTDERLSKVNTVYVAQRARDYIEEGFTMAIRLEDLCSHAGVGLRTLQRCFAAHYQISPTGYIKARRLNEARRNLVAADTVQCSVTEIAMACGFSHLGRFSVDYRAFFGETPRETLATGGASRARVGHRASSGQGKRRWRGPGNRGTSPAEGLHIAALRP